MNRKRWTLLACLIAVAITCLTLIAGAQQDDYDNWPDFSDVSDDHQFVDAIQDVFQRGRMNGYPDGTFRPDKNMTDRQIISVIGRMYNKTGGITRGQMADLITDSYPDLKWGHPEPCEQTILDRIKENQEQIDQATGWCVFLPISIPDSLFTSIRWQVVSRFYSNDWTWPNEPGLVIPVGSFQNTDDVIRIIVQYRTIGQQFQVIRHIYAQDCRPDDRLVCWGNETRICHSDGNTIGGNHETCWFGDEHWIDIDRPRGGQKWTS